MRIKRECGKNFRDSGRDIALLVVEYLPLQSGGLSVSTTCPYRHVAVSPPKLVYPPGQLSARVVLCSAGSAGSVTTSLHAGSRFVQSASES